MRGEEGGQKRTCATGTTSRPLCGCGGGIGGVGYRRHYPTEDIINMPVGKDETSGQSASAANDVKADDVVVVVVEEEEEEETKQTQQARKTP